MSRNKITSVSEPERRLLALAAQALKGRRIVVVRYTKSEEAEHSGWMRRSIVLELDDGHLVWPASDDEGNDAGALFTTIDTAPILPRL